MCVYKIFSPKLSLLKHTQWKINIYSCGARSYCQKLTIVEKGYFCQWINQHMCLASLGNFCTGSQSFHFHLFSYCTDNRDKETIHSGKECEDPVYVREAGVILSTRSHASFALASPWRSQTVRASGLNKKVLESTQERKRERRRFLACIEHSLYVEPHAN